MRAGIISVPYRGGSVDIEHKWLNLGRRGAPLIVFLHEGLGSVSTWREFPERLCNEGGFRGLVYARPGYGRSTRRYPSERWTPSYMHEQARDLLPALLTSLGVDSEADPVWLLGHSDGGSIALIFAATFPHRAAGLIALAPHIFVEDISIQSIKAARTAYWAGPLRDKLLRHHASAESAFWGWNDVWLDPAFRAWNIEALLPGIACPVLAVQGLDDEYGTLAQIEGIASVLPHTEWLTLPACGHSVHRAEPDRLTRAGIDFVARHTRPIRTPVWTSSPS